MDGSFEQQVRQRAYEIWVALGQADGHAHEHWRAAEQDLMAQPAKPKKPRASRAKSAEAKAAGPKAPRAKSAKVSKTAN